MPKTTVVIEIATFQPDEGTSHRTRPQVAMDKSKQAYNRLYDTARSSNNTLITPSSMLI